MPKIEILLENGCKEVGKLIEFYDPDFIVIEKDGSDDGKLPSGIYEQYMAAWKDVNLVPKNVKLDKLVDHLQKV